LGKNSIIIRIFIKNTNIKADSYNICEHHVNNCTRNAFATVHSKLCSLPIDAMTLSRHSTNALDGPIPVVWHGFMTVTSLVSLSLMRWSAVTYSGTQRSFEGQRHHWSGYTFHLLPVNHTHCSAYDVHTNRIVD